MSASEEESQGPVIRDRRRIDPVTGQPQGAGCRIRRGPGRAAGPGSPGPASTRCPSPAASARRLPGDDAGASPRRGLLAAARPRARRTAAPGDVAVKLAERTADLQRVQAEYANYRKRVDRDRAAVREQALASVVAELLPVLDDIGRAREHGELTGGFKAVAEALEAAAGKLGLTTFGKAGEVFDPNVHEALMHSYSADVTEPTCVQVLQPGYKVGERILRPARVAVAEPTDPAGARTASDESSGEGGTGDASGEDGHRQCR